MIGGIVVAVALLLVAAGVEKVRRPAPTARALRDLGLPGRLPLARALGAAEIAIGLLAAVGGNRVADLLLAAAYAGFTLVTLVPVLRGTRGASCGCFGERPAPPLAVHLALTVGAAAVALLAARAPAGPLPTVLARQPLHGLPLLALAACGAWLGTVVLGELGGLQLRRARETA